MDAAVISDPAKDSEALLEKQLTLSETKTESNESKDIADEMDLDFEEISDGELEEEARIRGLGDALGVDWASLVEESKAIAREKSFSTQTSAKQRWQPHSILLDVGISHKWAGKAFAYKILIDAQRKRKEEKEKIKEEGMFKVKQEKFDKDYGDIQGTAVTTTTMNVNKIKREVNLLPLINHPIACVQVANRCYVDSRKNLIFKATGPYSRALSARADLQMRRVLCGLPKREIGCSEAVQKIDRGYAAMAFHLFQRAIKEKN